MYIFIFLQQKGKEMIEPNYKNFKDLFTSICIIKANVVKLDRDNLKAYKCCFFKQKYARKYLDALWCYIWSDLTYIETIQRCWKKLR